MARAHAALRQSKTFVYFFNRRPGYFPNQHFAEQDPPQKYGAYHSLEQVYLYNNLDRSAPPRPYTRTDRQIAAIASAYLVNFATRGDPNGRDLPRWPEFVGNSSELMYIGDTIHPGPFPFPAGFGFTTSMAPSGACRSDLLFRGGRIAPSNSLIDPPPMTHVRFGSKADMCGAPPDVRSYPESGYERCTRTCRLRATSGHREKLAERPTRWPMRRPDVAAMVRRQIGARLSVMLHAFFYLLFWFASKFARK